MADWPNDITDFSPFGAFSTMAEGSALVDLMLAWGLLFSGGVTWPIANLAIYVPVVVRSPTPVYQLGWVNGGAVSGNVDVGIYSRSLARLVSAGSTAQAGASAIQMVDTADTTLLPDLYYLAMAMDNTTGSVQMSSGSVQASIYRAHGIAQQASALPLPATATFAAMAQSRAPLVLGAMEGAIF